MDDSGEKLKRYCTRVEKQPFNNLKTDQMIDQSPDQDLNQINDLSQNQNDHLINDLIQEIIFLKVDQNLLVIDRNHLMMDLNLLIKKLDLLIKILNPLIKDPNPLTKILNPLTKDLNPFAKMTKIKIETGVVNLEKNQSFLNLNLKVLEKHLVKIKDLNQKKVLRSN